MKQQLTETKGIAEQFAETSRRLRLYIRPPEAAEVLGVSERTLGNWQKARIVPFRKVGRCVLFRLTDLEAALDRFTVAAVASPSTRRRAGRIAQPTPTPTA